MLDQDFIAPKARRIQAQVNMKLEEISLRARRYDILNRIIVYRCSTLWELNLVVRRAMKFSQAQENMNHLAVCIWKRTMVQCKYKEAIKF